jgi:signal transduction histidine kinase
MKIPINPRSITARLITAVLAVELLSSILVVFLSFGYERHSHFHAFDVLIRGHADSLLGAVQDSEDANDSLILDPTALHTFPSDVYEVYDSGGHLLGRSPNWQGLGFALPAAPPANSHGDHHGDSHSEFLNLKINGQDYRALRALGTRLVGPGDFGDHDGKVRTVVILYGAPTDKVWHAIFGTVEFYAAGTLFLLLVTGPLIAWLLHRGLAPLRQLAALAGQVSVDSWHFNPPSSARATPELAPLTHAIEEVLLRLQVSFEQQRAFVSDAAHELKTAVAVAKSSLQLLAMKRRTPDEYQAGLDRCLTDSQRLEELVAEMLTLARIEAAPVSDPSSGPPHSTDLISALRQTVATLSSVADLRGIHIESQFEIAHGESAPVTVPVPHDNLSLLLSNLLLNAVQHSPFASTVSLRVAIVGNATILTIEDHGDGISSEALPHIFDRFYRGDPSRNRNSGGTGLGLAIARAIVVKARGSIHLASQLGLGTTATVRLPLTTQTPAS